MSAFAPECRLNELFLGQSRVPIKGKKGGQKKQNQIRFDLMVPDGTCEASIFYDSLKHGWPRRQLTLSSAYLSRSLNFVIWFLMDF
jgi:hypothetical protein